MGALHSYDVLAESAGEPTPPHSATAPTLRPTSLRGAVEEQAPAVEEHALTVEEQEHIVWVYLPPDVFEVLTASMCDQGNGTVEEQAPASEKQATASRRLAWQFFVTSPFWIYGFYTTGTPGMGLKPAPNMYTLWKKTSSGGRGAFHGGGVDKGIADWF